ncbi:hypothetical protein AB0E04_42130 [Streptomyces sp. NPDC048251]|uniref:hypothetical protein n=1 Tax=Streptomyces sp. NPDC048251 TaxID=3154501 RepID=UPI00341248C3
MTSMQPSPLDGDGPREPRGLVPAMAGGYVAGYAAALGAGTSVVGASAGQTTAVVLVQGATAALCWTLLRKRM